MFDNAQIQCPGCGITIDEKLEDGKEFACTFCGSHYKVLRDPELRNVGFVEVHEKSVPEPLRLPRGSIRAFVTVLLTMCAFLLVLTGEEIPGCHLNLLLAIIGYYFGFRLKMKAARSRIYDAATRQNQPLFLPAGCVRLFLVAALVATVGLLWHRGRLDEIQYAEFFIILSGLILGYFTARMMSGRRGPGLYTTLNHLKGAIVLAAALSLFLLLVTGLHTEFGYLSLVLAAVVTFYFGSRS